MAASGARARRSGRAAQVVELGPEEVERLRSRKGIRLVDVRQAFEHWLERIPGSELLPLGSFSPDSLANADGELVLYCRSGHRSGVAAAEVSSVSGRPIRHLAGGLLAWKAAGLPTERWGFGRSS